MKVPCPDIAEVLAGVSHQSGFTVYRPFLRWPWKPRALALESWEGNIFKEMLSQAMPLRLVRDVQPSKETLATLTRRLHEKFDHTADDIASPPTSIHRKALLAMALHLDSGVNLGLQV